MNYRSVLRSFLLFFTSLLFFLSVLQIIFGLNKHLRSGLFDYKVYHQYGRTILSGRSPYDPEFTKGIPFNYPPSSFLLFAPFSLLPLQTSSLIFTAFSLLFFIVVTYLFLESLIPSKPVRLLLLALLLQNFPTKFTLVAGQVNLIVLSFLLLSFLYDQKNRLVLSGLLWGSAVMIKLTPITLLVYFLFRKKYLTLVSGITFFTISNIFFLIIQPQTIYYFITHLPGLLGKSGFVTTFYDQSLRAFFSRLGIPHDAGLATVVVLLFLGLAIFNFLRQKSPQKELIFFSQILLITTIGNAFAWQHHFVFIFPALISASILILSKKSLLLFTLTLLCALLIGYHIPNLTHTPISNPFFVSHTLIGTLILFGILFVY